MSLQISNIILPIGCAVVFCVGAFAAMSMGGAGSSDEAVDPHAAPKVETEKVQYSFPVFSKAHKIGHCVIAVRSNRADPDSKFIDKNRISQEDLIYNKAKGLLEDAEDGTKSCKKLYDSVKKKLPVVEFVFLTK